MHVVAVYLVRQTIKDGGDFIVELDRIFFHHDDSVSQCRLQSFELKRQVVVHVRMR